MATIQLAENKVFPNLAIKTLNQFKDMTHQFCIVAPWTCLFRSYQLAFICSKQQWKNQKQCVKSVQS